MKKLHNSESIVWGYTQLKNVLSDIERTSEYPATQTPRTNLVICSFIAPRYHPMKDVPALMKASVVPKDWKLYHTPHLLYTTPHTLCTPPHTPSAHHPAPSHRTNVRMHLQNIRQPRLSVLTRLDTAARRAIFSHTQYLPKKKNQPQAPHCSRIML
jgi:hypothetical protein